MNILEEIIIHKRKEVQARKERYPVKLLEESVYFKTPTVSLSKYLEREDKSGIIAEFKRRSPSKGAINSYAKVQDVSLSYMQAGASALSVLTDSHFFGGKNEDLTQARDFNYCPILRKDFIIDEYQIVEAKSIGADAILLIAACLNAKRLDGLTRFAQSLGLEVLVELHGQEDLDKLSPAANLVGVNNRDLKSFKVSIQHSIDLFPLLPKEMVKISESGISSSAAVAELKAVGFQGFLIGEHFMKQDQPGLACRNFIEAVKNKEQLHTV